ATTANTFVQVLKIYTPVVICLEGIETHLLQKVRVSTRPVNQSVYHIRYHGYPGSRETLIDDRNRFIPTHWAECNMLKYTNRGGIVPYNLLLKPRKPDGK